MQRLESEIIILYVSTELDISIVTFLFYFISRQRSNGNNVIAIINHEKITNVI